MLAAQKKSLKKKRKDARRQASTESNTGNISPHVKRATNIVKGKPGNLSGRVSKAFDCGDFDEALSLLFAMRYLEQVPKLGTLQRWVASLGDNTTVDPIALGLLYAILRVANGLGIKLQTTNNIKTILTLEKEDNAFNCQNNKKNAKKLCQSNSEEIDKKLYEYFNNFSIEGQLKCIEEWEGIPLQKVNLLSSSILTNNEKEDVCEEGKAEKTIKYSDYFNVLTNIEGSARTPPNRHNLAIYECIPGAMNFKNENNHNSSPSSSISSSSLLPQVKRIDIDCIPKAFVLTSLLTPKECLQIIQVSEDIGYVPDEPIMKTTRNLVASTSAGLDDRAANFTWLADEIFLNSILSRCKHLFPQYLDNNKKSKFYGLNARFRLYRYYPGSIYRPHVDGAWPESGKNSETNEYEYDVSKGKIRSKLTFLIYLNEGFQGGHTTFFTSNNKIEGEIHANKVLPRVGMALCFPHGEYSGSLIHEGSNLLSGVKYVLRSDVLYTVPDKDTIDEQTNKKEEEEDEKETSNIDNNDDNDDSRTIISNKKIKIK